MNEIDDYNQDIRDEVRHEVLKEKRRLQDLCRHPDPRDPDHPEDEDD